MSEILHFKARIIKYSLVYLNIPEVIFSIFPRLSNQFQMKHTLPNKSLRKKLTEFSLQADLMPSVVMVQQLDPFLCVYMSQRGLNELGISAQDLEEIGSEYLSKFFNLEGSQDYLQKLKKLLETNTEESFTFFQQVRFKN